MNMTVKNIIFGLIILVGFLSGCSDQEDIYDGIEAPLAKEETAPAEDWPPTFEREIYGDPEIFSTPRIQFIAYVMGVDDERKKLWSMRKDGSDRRLVADYYEMFGGAGVVHKPLRSPDNRYVALSLDDGEFFRGIIDLKEQKAIRIVKGGGYPHFNWTSDSKELYFYSDGKLMHYFMDTGELKQERTIYSIGLFLLPDDQTFLAMKNDGYWLHKLDGSVIKKVDFGYPDRYRIASPAVSPDGKLLAFMVSGKVNTTTDWIEIGSEEIKGSAITEELVYGLQRPVFSDKPETLFYAYGAKYYEVDLKTRESIFLSPLRVKNWWMAGANSYSLINYNKSKYKRN